MRACFLGQNVCALGYGVAMVQTPPAAAAPDDGCPSTTAVLPPADQTEGPMFADLKRRGLAFADSAPDFSPIAGDHSWAG